jgi:uncharacterized protein
METERRPCQPLAGAEASESLCGVRFLGDLAAGNLIAEPVRPADWIRIAELVSAYRDLPLGTVDASVVAAAERLDLVALATLDRRHFTIVRPAHAAVFEIVP